MDEATRDLVRAADGDPAAFDRFVRATEPDVRRVLAWWGRPGDDLDDVVQETYLRAFRGLSTFRGDSPARSWLVSIARRARADQAAGERRVERTVAAAVDRSSLVQHTDGPSHLVDVVRELPDLHREAFVLVRMMGYSYDDAARIIGCPRGTVQSRVARARLRLAEALRGEPPDADRESGPTGADGTRLAAG